MIEIFLFEQRARSSWFITFGIRKRILPLSELENFGKFNSRLGGTPRDRNKVPGVEASTGPLGHGFPKLGIGVALWAKNKENKQSSFCSCW